MKNRSNFDSYGKYIAYMVKLEKELDKITGKPESKTSEKQRRKIYNKRGF
jgi:hypothetical protein